MHDLLVDTDFKTEMQYADPSTFQKGQVGVYAGCAIFDGGTRGITVADDGSSIAVTLATIIGAQAIAMGDPAATSVFTVSGADHADPYARRNLVTATGYKGAIINDSQSVRVVNIAAVSSLA